MLTLNSSSRTLRLIGLSVLIHGAAFWAFNERFSLASLRATLQEAHSQANRSEIWESLARSSQPVEINVARAEDPSKVESDNNFATESKKIETLEPQAKAPAPTSSDQTASSSDHSKTRKKTSVATLSKLPKKEKKAELEKTEPENTIPQNTVDVSSQDSLIPVQERLDGVEPSETEASAQVRTLPQELEETDLLSELKEQEKAEEELRSYMNLQQAQGNRPPQYPLAARQQGQQGRVILKYFVTEKGLVESIQVKESSGFDLLDQEAIRAISNYRYYPGQPGWTEHPIKFTLKQTADEKVDGNLGAN